MTTTEMTATKADAIEATTTKITRRILAEMANTKHANVIDAITAAAMAMEDEARALGWSDRQVAGLVSGIADIGAHMVATTIRHLAGDLALTD